MNAIMPQHYDATIGVQGISQEDQARKMEELKQRLATDLRLGFEREVGFPIPSYNHAEILALDAALKYCDEVKKSEFLAGVRTLMNSKFDVDSRIRAWAMNVVNTAMNNIFDVSPQNGTRGHHESYEERSGQDIHKILFAAAYASTLRCIKEEWSTERDFYMSQYAFVVFKVRLDEILGKYECHVYDGSPQKNDWHYVTISRLSDAEIEWANKAGMKWKLTATSQRTTLAVGQDCPYFKRGHTAVTVVWNGSQVSGLYGPHHEFYAKSV
jgi:hypothetical protein